MYKQTRLQVKNIGKLLHNKKSPPEEGGKVFQCTGGMLHVSFHLTDTQYMHINYVTRVSLNKNRGNRYKTKRKNGK